MKTLTIEQQKRVMSVINDFELNTKKGTDDIVYKRFYLSNYLRKHNYKFKEIALLLNCTTQNAWLGVKKYNELLNLDDTNKKKQHFLFQVLIMDISISF